MFEDKPFSFHPVAFFAIACDCFYLLKREQTVLPERYLLPSTNNLMHEESFANVSMGWHEEGIEVQVEVNCPFSQSFYPVLEQGDSVELFFDTRDLKSSGFNTRFCHHFFFLPQSIEGITKGEKTHFRTEDNHPLCDSQALHCQTQLRKKNYLMKIFIPSQCLYGYDPKQLDRLGFTYRINRHKGEAQHFSVASQDYQINQQPSLWGSLKLVK